MSRRRVHAGDPCEPVSIVIATVNQEQCLPRLLASLALCGSRPLDVIVVDGRSEDGTCDVVERFRRAAPANLAIRSFSSPVRNVSALRNQGAAAARHGLLLFLDADVVLAGASVLDRMVERFRTGRLAAASCRVRPCEWDLRAELCYALLNGFHKLVERWDPHPLGACVLTTRDVFRYTGGFDPRIRLHREANFARKAACVGRFRILPVTVRVSAGRLRRHGYLRGALRFVGRYLERRFHGEAFDRGHAGDHRRHV